MYKFEKACLYSLQGKVDIKVLLKDGHTSTHCHTDLHFIQKYLSTNKEDSEKEKKKAFQRKKKLHSGSTPGFFFFFLK